MVLFRLTLSLTFRVYVAYWPLTEPSIRYFLAHDPSVKISGSNHVVERICLGIMKWYMQMPMSSLSLSLVLVSGCGRKRFDESRWARASCCVLYWGSVPVRLTTGLRLSTLRPKSRRSAKLGLEDNTECYGQEKKNGSIWQFVCASLSLSLMHLPKRWRLNEWIKTYIFL